MYGRVPSAACSIACVGLYLVFAGPAEARGPHPATNPNNQVFAQPAARAGLWHRKFSQQASRRSGKFGGGLGFVSGGGWGGPQGAGTVLNINLGEGSPSGVQAAAGIREAPAARPAIYVIDERRDRIMTRREGRPSSARVIGRDDHGQWAELENDTSISHSGPVIIRVPIH